jgi:hypothetical protein
LQNPFYWSNGNANMHPRSESEAGEGWFVIISEEGLNDIKGLNNNLFFHKKLKRHRGQDYSGKTAYATSHL